MSFVITYKIFPHTKTMGKALLLDVLEELDTELKDGTHSFEEKLLAQFTIPLSNPICSIITRGRVEKTINVSFLEVIPG